MQFFFIKNIPPCFLRNFLKNSKKYPIKNKHNKHFIYASSPRHFLPCVLGSYHGAGGARGSYVQNSRVRAGGLPP